MDAQSKSPQPANSEITPEVTEYAKLLKARLQYARYKVEHDLVKNTFSEIEAALSFPRLAPQQHETTDLSPSHEAASTLAAIRKRCDLPPTPHSPPKNVSIPLKRRSSSSDDFESEEAAQTILMLSSGAGTPKLSNARSPVDGTLSPRIGPNSPTLPYSLTKKSVHERQQSKLSNIEPQDIKEWPFRERSHERGSLSPRFITIPSRHIEADLGDNPFLVANPSSPKISAAKNRHSNKTGRQPTPKQQGVLTDSFRLTKPLNGMRNKRL
ncbi:hypothetical protein BGW37DRAFT_521426 [Umbelopsis sp. PMI_123]|nr:hypothetical protein BGW37DRAFT_521426 [Umbelopsis sp. PMI_123]